MPFLQLDKFTRAGIMARQSSNEVRMATHIKEGKAGMIYFSFTEDVIQRAGIPVLEAKGDEERVRCMIAIQEGVGDDAGFLLVTPVAEDGVGYMAGMSRKSAHSLTVNVSLTRFKHYMVGSDNVSAHVVEFTVDEDDHSILIQCPKWLVYNPQSYVELPKLPAPEPKKTEDRKPRQPTKPSDRIVAKVAAMAFAEKAAGDLLNNRKDRRMAVSVATRMLRK